VTTRSPSAICCRISMQVFGQGGELGEEVLVVAAEGGKPDVGARQRGVVDAVGGQ